jgi:hypothetical protein
MRGEGREDPGVGRHGSPERVHPALVHRRRERRRPLRVGGAMRRETVRRRAGRRTVRPLPHRRRHGHRSGHGRRRRTHRRAERRRRGRGHGRRHGRGQRRPADGHRRHADHRPFQLVRDLTGARHLRCSRRPSGRCERAWRSGRGGTGGGRAGNDSGLIHHQHRSLELRGCSTLQMEAALRARLSRVGILRATVRTEHSGPPCRMARLPEGSAATPFRLSLVCAKITARAYEHSGSGSSRSSDLSPGGVRPTCAGGAPRAQLSGARRPAPPRELGAGARLRAAGGASGAGRQAAWPAMTGVARGGRAGRAWPAGGARGGRGLRGARGAAVACGGREGGGRAGGTRPTFAAAPSFPLSAREGAARHGLTCVHAGH